MADSKFFSDNLNEKIKPQATVTRGRSNSFNNTELFTNHETSEMYKYHDKEMIELSMLIQEWGISSMRKICRYKKLLQSKEGLNFEVELIISTLEALSEFFVEKNEYNFNKANQEINILKITSDTLKEEWTCLMNSIKKGLKMNITSLSLKKNDCPFLSDKTDIEAFLKACKRKFFLIGEGSKGKVYQVEKLDASDPSVLKIAKRKYVHPNTPILERHYNDFHQCDGYKTSKFRTAKGDERRQKMKFMKGNTLNQNLPEDKKMLMNYLLELANKGMFIGDPVFLNFLVIGKGAKKQVTLVDFDLLLSKEYLEEQDELFDHPSADLIKVKKLLDYLTAWIGEYDNSVTSTMNKFWVINGDIYNELTSKYKEFKTYCTVLNDKLKKKLNLTDYTKVNKSSQTAETTKGSTIGVPENKLEVTENKLEVTENKLEVPENKLGFSENMLEE